MAVKMLKENLHIALLLAIELREKHEAELGYLAPSAMLAGWIEICDALDRDEKVEICTT